MAVLYGKTGEIQLLLRPYRLSDEEQPAWLSTQLQITKGAVIILSETLSLTREDLNELRAGVSDVSEGHRPYFDITTADADFVLHAEGMALPGDVAIGFWVGEPYDLMQGYRFVVYAADLCQFATDLLSDELLVGPPGRLP